MAMVAILKMSYPKCTTTHPNDHSCEISLQSDIFFNSHGYHGNGGHFENVKP